MKTKQPQTLSVGQVAKRSGVNVSTLHFYEQKGLITSSRNTGNQRRYNKEVLRRVSVIKAAQKVGISLDEIKKAISKLPNNRTPTVSDWEKLSKIWQKELDAKIEYLQVLRNSLTGCIGCGCLSMKKCPIVNTEDRLNKFGSGPIILDNKKVRDSL